MNCRELSHQLHQYVYVLHPLNVVFCVHAHQVPMYVATKMASIRNPSFFAPSPEAYARAAIRYIGYEPRCTLYWPHALWKLVSLLPGPVADRVILNMTLDGRTKGRAKDARKKTQ